MIHCPLCPARAEKDACPVEPDVTCSCCRSCRAACASETFDQERRLAELQAKRAAELRAEAS